jgi:hypothetical protein
MVDYKGSDVKTCRQVELFGSCTSIHEFSHLEQRDSPSEARDESKGY